MAHQIEFGVYLVEMLDIEHNLLGLHSQIVRKLYILKPFSRQKPSDPTLQQNHFRFIPPKRRYFHSKRTLT